MTSSRILVIAFASLVGISATTSANAGFFTDVGKKVVGKAADVALHRPSGNTRPQPVPRPAPAPQQRPQTAQAGTDWSWVNNKPYIDCLNLFARGNFLIPAGSTQAQIDALHEKGRKYCNRQYYGHD